MGALVRIRGSKLPMPRVEQASSLRAMCKQEWATTVHGTHTDASATHMNVLAPSALKVVVISTVSPGGTLPSAGSMLNWLTTKDAPLFVLGLAEGVGGACLAWKHTHRVGVHAYAQIIGWQAGEWFAPEK